MVRGLHIKEIEPASIPGTGLWAGEANASVRLVRKLLVPLLKLIIEILSSSNPAARGSPKV
jgi:hypothetical protein